MNTEQTSNAQRSTSNAQIFKLAIVATAIREREQFARFGRHFAGCPSRTTILPLRTNTRSVRGKIPRIASRMLALPINYQLSTINFFITLNA
jgi:hypothetical protein